LFRRQFLSSNTWRNPAITGGACRCVNRASPASYRGVTLSGSKHD
jgi:hypothetical protein